MDTQQWLLYNSFWTGYLGHIFAALLYRCCPFLPAGVKLMVAFLNFPPNMKHFFPFTFWPLYVQYTASILVLLFHTARNWIWHMWVFAKLNFILNEKQSEGYLDISNCNISIKLIFELKIICFSTTQIKCLFLCPNEFQCALVVLLCTF